MQDLPINSPIGIFDSGVGGLTVFKSIKELLPEENLLYFGDVARVPYGVKSPSLVKKYSFQITNYLVKRGIKALVVACNTSSSTSLEFLKKNFSIPILGVILPAVKEAISKTKDKKIGVIGTRTTIESGAYENLIKSFGKGIKILAKPAPLLVPLVEEGWIEEGVTRIVIRKYLSPIEKWGADTVILGCTHYPLLRKVIEEEFKRIKFVDSSKAVAQSLLKLLKKEKLEGGEGREEFLLTDKPEYYLPLFSFFLGREIKEIKLVKLEELDGQI